MAMTIFVWKNRELWTARVRERGVRCQSWGYTPQAAIAVARDYITELAPDALVEVVWR